MKHLPQLQFNTFYHIYNRGINGETLFMEPANYEHFLRLYAAHISPIAETFAWVLMNNHFHLLVRIYSVDEIGFIQPREDKKLIIYQEKKKYNPTQQFGNLFNAYAKAYNLKYGRSGGMFESPFRRLMINNEWYFKKLVYYIHYNPVHHGFCKEMSDYPWSSWLTMLSFKPANLERDKVIGWFNSKSEFVEFHQNKQDLRTISLLTIE